MTVDEIREYYRYILKNSKRTREFNEDELTKLMKQVNNYTIYNGKEVYYETFNGDELVELKILKYNYRVDENINCSVIQINYNEDYIAFKHVFELFKDPVVEVFAEKSDEWQNLLKDLYYETLLGSTKESLEPEEIIECTMKIIEYSRYIIIYPDEQLTKLSNILHKKVYASYKVEDDNMIVSYIEYADSTHYMVMCNDDIKVDFTWSNTGLDISVLKLDSLDWQKLLYNLYIESLSGRK